MKLYSEFRQYTLTPQDIMKYCTCFVTWDTTKRNSFETFCIDKYPQINRYPIVIPWHSTRVLKRKRKKKKSIFKLETISLNRREQKFHLTKNILVVSDTFRRAVIACIFYLVELSICILLKASLQRLLKYFSWALVKCRYGMYCKCNCHKNTLIDS